MACNSVVISSGHGLYVRGAAGIIDEVDEARLVVETVANELRHRGVDTVTFHDDVSMTQNENLNRIVDFHNSKVRDLDISIHFNAYEQVSKPMGTECLYVTQSTLAGAIADAISESGNLICRGGKKRSDLFFLNETSGPSILIEVCFVDSETDCLNYRDNYDEICSAIADVIGGDDDEDDDNIIPIPPESEVQTGTCSYFGGPSDQGVADDEGLAFIYAITEENQFLFLPFQPEGTGSGLARRLNTEVHYCAMRFDYDVHPKETLLSKRALVRNPRTNQALTCVPADWGPHESTGRLIDLSPSMMRDLELETDDEVEVTFPF